MLFQLSIDKFDVEHIATKDQMKSLNRLTNGEGLPISHIANLCYLPEYENRSKGSKNFYQDDEYLKKNGNTLDMIETKYSFTKAQDLEFMDLPYTDSDFDALKEYYLEFINSRNKVIKDKFLTALGFTTTNALETNNVEEHPFQYELDEKYLRVTKIGKLVVQSIKKLANENLLNDDDISNLSNKEFSSRLGCWLPILVYDESDLGDRRNRYYSDKITINCNDYYLCKEWREENRKKFLLWLKEILSRR